MNKRIAKKITKGPKTICRIWQGERYYWDRYNTEQIKQARRIYFRHNHVGYTERLVTYARTMSESNARDLLINRWPNLRRIILKNIWSKQPDPIESLAWGRESAPEELRRNEALRQASQTEPFSGWPPSVVEAVLLDMEYYSDRWCYSHVGRMDVFIESLGDDPQVTSP